MIRTKRRCVDKKNWFLKKKKKMFDYRQWGQWKQKNVVVLSTRVLWILLPSVYYVGSTSRIIILMNTLFDILVRNLKTIHLRRRRSRETFIQYYTYRYHDQCVIIRVQTYSLGRGPLDFYGNLISICVV